MTSFSLFFFFSSRRRHTRYIGDWIQTCALPISHVHLQRGQEPRDLAADLPEPDNERTPAGERFRRVALPASLRSEERRVGKEWRSRSAAQRRKKKSKTEGYGEVMEDNRDDVGTE